MSQDVPKPEALAEAAPALSPALSNKQVLAHLIATGPYQAVIGFAAHQLGGDHIHARTALKIFDLLQEETRLTRMEAEEGAEWEAREIILKAVMAYVEGYAEDVRAAREARRLRDERLDAAQAAKARPSGA